MERENSVGEPRPSTRTDLALFAAIVVIAFGVRYAFLLQARAVPLFHALLMDGESYGAWSDRIVAGDWLGDRTFYQAPLYPYFLAVVKLVVGNDLWSIRLVQIALGSLACGILFSAGRAFFSRGAGVAAGVLLALYPPAIFFDALIQKANLGLVWTVLLLWCLARVRGSYGFARWLAVGATLGLLMLTREETILLVPVLALWLLLARRDSTLAWRAFARQRARACAGWLAGLALVLLPVGVRNQVVGGEFLLTTSQAGSNFYIGNNPKSVGTYQPLRPGRSNVVYERADAIDLAQQAVGRELLPGEVSRYWFGKSFEWIRAEPGAWLRLLGRKLALLFNAYELPDAEDLYFYERYSPLLRGLGFLLHYGTLVPLAVLGMWWTRRRRGELALLYLALATFCAGPVIFYVFARYRYPVVPVFALFAGAGLAHAWSLVRARNFGALIGPALAALVIATLVNWPMFSKDFQWPQAHNNAGIALTKLGDDEAAVAQFRASLALKPNSPEVLGNLGVSLVNLRRYAEAIEAYRAAQRLRPGDGRGELRLGSTLVLAGELQEGLQYLQRSVTLRPKTGEGWSWYGEALMRAGRWPEALDALHKARMLAPDDPLALERMAWLRATAPDAALRDGTEALALAQRAERASTPTARTLDVLAAAHAELGDFAQAVVLAERALLRASDTDETGLSRAIEARLALYRSSNAFRELR